MLTASHTAVSLKHHITPCKSIQAVTGFTSWSHSPCKAEILTKVANSKAQIFNLYAQVKGQWLPVEGTECDKTVPASSPHQPHTHGTVRSCWRGGRAGFGPGAHAWVSTSTSFLFNPFPCWVSSCLRAPAVWLQVTTSVTYPDFSHRPPLSSEYGLPQGLSG